MNRALDLIRGMATLLLLGGLGAWVFWKMLKDADDAKVFAKKVGFTLLLLAILIFGVMPRVLRGGYGGAFTIVFAAALALVIGIIWAPTVGGYLADLLGGLYMGADTAPDIAAQYSVAMSFRKRGEPRAAAVSIRQELEKFPTDALGWLLLADVQAHDLHDLPAAEQSILELCGQPNHAPKTIAAAFHTLADYQLSVGKNAEAARQAMRQIIERYPDTELAQRAAQRIAHLVTPQQIVKPERPAPIKLTPGVEHIGLLRPLEMPDLVPPEDLDETAAQLVKHLTAHPLDNDAREQLAALYADHFGRLDLAFDQLEQLISQPGQSQKHVVNWLNRMADLQVKHGNSENLTIARGALNRIRILYPDSAAATLALERMEKLPNEVRVRRETPTIKLGHYEQHLGLKQSAPRGRGEGKTAAPESDENGNSNLTDDPSRRRNMSA